MFLKINKSITEEELIRACRKGNSKAQREVYQKFSSRMLGVCLRYIKAEDEAEDVMISGFTKVFMKIDQYQGDGSFEGWIRKIMVNEALGYIRKNKNMYLEVELEKAAIEPDYDKLEKSLETEDLLKLIRELPSGYRTVFNLYAIEGYNHREIADSLGVSENTSKSQLSRARSLLQKKLAELDSELKIIRR